MNPYSQFIHKSRYARFRDDLGRRETWEETITRYLDYFEQDLNERHSYKLSQTLRSELYDAIHSLSIMPSMRAMMTAGEAARRCNVGVFNCLGGDTLVTTKEYGPVPIKELSGKSATIVDGNGSWQTVEFKSYGEQECYEVYALKGRRKVSIWATKNHDWVSIDGEKVRTEDIKNGLRVPHVIPPRNEIEYDHDYHLGLMHGVIYGDGTTMVRSTGGSTVKDFFVCERVHGYTIAACTDFEEIKPVFVNDFFKCSFAEPRLNARGQVLFGRYTVPTNISRCVHMKELPESSESESYLIGFLRGWLAADGYISKTSQVSIAAGKEECEWIKQTYAKFGIVTGNVYEFPSRTNFGERKKVLFKVDLDRRCLVEDDFILPRKRERFIPLDNGSIKLHVGKETRVMEVFCCTVPTTGSFVIEDNILTGNCSFSAIDTVRSFSEILYILMCGTGVGFSVERQSVSQLPPVPDTLTKTDHVIVVGDSKQGWAEAYNEFIQGLYAGHIARIDYSEIRPAGARLMTFGGRSSGPEPLRELFEFTTQIFHAARGRKLNSLECHSLCCKIGEIVVVGGVRRSALISLSNLSDQRMRDAKSGNWWMESPYLALANNSVAYTEKPEVGSFMDEWSSLYRSRSGERGIFNRQGAIRKVTASGRRDPRYDFGTNPCVTGDTPILTSQGYQAIRDCVGHEVSIWNGNEWSTVTPFSTGENRLVTVTFSDGTSLTCTPYHKFILQNHGRGQHFKKEAQYLNAGDKLAKFSMPIISGKEEYEGDAYSQGFYQGDGNANLNRSWVYIPKMICASRLKGRVGEVTRWGRADWVHGDMLPKSFVPMHGTLQYKADWIAGLLDADGTVVRDNGVALQLTSVDVDFLKHVRLMLTTMGVQAKVHPDGRGVHECMGYESRPTYRLLINQTDTQTLVRECGVAFSRLDVPVQDVQRDARRFVTVVSVEDLDRTEETFCFTEPKNNSGTFAGIVTGQCGEIILRSREFCNLTETVVRPDDTESSLAEKIRLASILGTFQSTQTTYQFLSDDWRRNSEEERLLGVSLTGIFNSPLMSEHGPDLRARLARLKSVAISANVDMAHQVGIPVSAAVTTVKPSGTVSQLVNSPSGIHPSHAPFYIRRVRGDNKDPLTAFLRDAGVPCEPAVGKEDTTSVFSFPMQSHATKYREDISAIEHLRLIRDYNMHWSEHAVSCTVSVRENEWPSVGGWVYDHFDELAGVSFLPFFEGDTVYPQMPYETITREAYEAMAKDMPESIPWDILATYEGGKDHTKGSQELACVAGACEIVDIS